MPVCRDRRGGCVGLVKNKYFSCLYIYMFHLKRKKEILVLKEKRATTEPVCCVTACFLQSNFNH